MPRFEPGRMYNTDFGDPAIDVTIYSDDGKQLHPVQVTRNADGRYEVSWEDRTFVHGIVLHLDPSLLSDPDRAARDTKRMHQTIERIAKEAMEAEESGLP